MLFHLLLSMALVPFCVLAQSTCVPQQVTIGPLQAVEDSYIEITNRTKVHGYDQDLWVSAANKRRTVVKFDQLRAAILPYLSQMNPICSDCIAEARLRFRVWGSVRPEDGWLDGNISVHPLDLSFCQKYANWDCRDLDDTGCCSTWRMSALLPQVKPSYRYQPAAVRKVTPYLQGWLEFDVTKDLQDFLEDSNSNSRSWLVKKQCESDPGMIRFWSCDGPGCPQLIINLSIPCSNATPCA